MKILVLSMDTEKGQMRRSLLNYEYEWIKSIDASEELKKRFSFRYNITDNKRKAIENCFASHLNILKHIVNNKLNEVVVCEDDCFKINDIDYSTIKDITLLGGVIRHPTSWDKDKEFQKNNDITFEEGVNKIDYKKYRWSGAFAIYYPSWEQSNDLLNTILSKTSYRHYDLFLSKNKLINYLYYPTPYIHCDNMNKEGCYCKSTSQIGGGDGIIENYKNLGKDRITFEKMKVKFQLEI